MQVDDIAIVKEDSTWGEGRLRGKTVIIDKGEGSYSVTEINGCGGGAWISGNELEFVRHGTKEDREMVTRNSEEVHRMFSDLNWIKENWIRNRFSATSILSLFHAIGYNSSFERNGEYFVLYEDWEDLYPIFNAIMNREYEKAIVETMKTFRPECVDKYIPGVIALYRKVNPE